MILSASLKCRSWVLDPLKVTLKVAEALVGMGVTHSRVGLYAPPTPKEFK